MSFYAPSASADYREIITPRVRSPDGTERKVKVKKFYPLNRFMKKVANQCGVRRYQVKFYHHGNTLDEWNAPCDYELDSTSLIKVVTIV